MADAASQVEGHGARITDEGIAKIRARIGKGFEGRRPWRTEVTRTPIYHMALAIGDLARSTMTRRTPRRRSGVACWPAAS